MGAVGAAIAVAAVVPVADAAATTYEPREIGLACPVGFVPEDGLVDAGPDGSVGERALDCLAAYEALDPGIDTQYRPDDFVVRGELASILMGVFDATRNATRPTTEPDFFTDDDGTPWEVDINDAAALGAMTGTGQTTFSPYAYVSRAQLASHLASTVWTSGTGIPYDPPDAWSDDEGTVHEWSINSLTAVGILDGPSPGEFAPNAPTTRGDVARYAARTLDYLVSRERIDPHLGLDDYPVVGLHRELDYGEQTTCSVDVPAGGRVVVALFGMLSPASSADGPVFPFWEEFGERLATYEYPSPLRFVSIDGSPTGELSDFERVVSDGSIDIVVRSQDGRRGDSIVVVYDEGDDARLDVDDGGVPVEPYGLGCDIRSGPIEASRGTHDATVTWAPWNGGGDYFRDETRRAYYFDEADSYLVDGTPLDGGFDAFVGLLSRGDVIHVQYAQQWSGWTSTFDVVTDVVWPVTSAGATFANDDGGLTANDVAVRFQPSVDNGSGTRFVVERWSAAHAGLDGACGTGDDVLTSGWSHVATVGPYDQPVVDHNVARGCHVYRVTATNPATGAVSDAVPTATLTTGLLH